jgi:hypothetical protein
MQSLVSAFRLRAEARGQVWQEQQGAVTAAMRRSTPAEYRPRFGKPDENGKRSRAATMIPFGDEQDDAVLKDF